METDLEVKHGENEHDQFVISIFYNKGVVEHAFKTLSKVFSINFITDRLHC